MAEITQEGIKTRSLTEFLAIVEQNFREAFGQDLDLSPETPQGQMAGILGLGFTEIEEAVAWVASGMSLYTSEGQQIDDWGSVLNLPRVAATYSTVQLEFTFRQPAGRHSSGLYPTIPLGSMVKPENSSVTWETTEEGQASTYVERNGSIETVQGTVPGRCSDLGEIYAPAGSLVVPVSVLSGLLSVTNPTTAIPGQAKETDTLYRSRHNNVVARASGSTLESLHAQLLLVQGVREVKIWSNPGPSPQDLGGGIVLPIHSVLVITREVGVQDTVIAQTILNSLPPGIPTWVPTISGVNSNSVSVNSLDPRLSGYSISWLEGRAVPIKIVLVINRLNGFPAGGLEEIHDRLVAYFGGSWSSGKGDFDTDGMAIGEYPDSLRITSPINSVPGHNINTMKIYHGGQGYTLLTPSDIPPDSYVVLNSSETTVQEYSATTLPEIQDRTIAVDTAFSYQMPQPLTGNPPFTFSIQAKQGSPDLPGDWALDSDTLLFSGDSGSTVQTYTLEFSVLSVSGSTSTREWDITVG